MATCCLIFFSFFLVRLRENGLHQLFAKDRILISQWFDERLLTRYGLPNTSARGSDFSGGDYFGAQRLGEAVSWWSPSGSHKKMACLSAGQGRNWPIEWDTLGGLMCFSSRLRLLHILSRKNTSHWNSVRITHDSLIKIGRQFVVDNYMRHIGGPKISILGQRLFLLDRHVGITRSADDWKWAAVLSMFHWKDLDTNEMICFDELRAQSERRVNAIKLEGCWYQIRRILAPLWCVIERDRIAHEVQISLTLWHHPTAGKQKIPDLTKQDMTSTRLPGWPNYKPHTSRVFWGHVLVAKPFTSDWDTYYHCIEEASKAKAWVLSCVYQWGQMVESEFWSGLGNISILSYTVIYTM